MSYDDAILNPELLPKFDRKVREEELTKRKVDIE